MLLARLLIATLHFVFAFWFRVLSLWFRPPATILEDGQDAVDSISDSGSIRASASASSCDALLSSRSDASCANAVDYADSPSSEAGFLSPDSTPELQYPSTTPLSSCHARNGRTCNIFSPPTDRRQYPARRDNTDTDLSHSSPRELQTPDMSPLSAQVPPPLIFTFDEAEDDDDAAVDLETGLGVRLGNASSRNSSIILGSSASIFSKLSIEGLLSPSRPTTPAPSPVASPSKSGSPSASCTKLTLPLYAQDLVSVSNGGSPSFGMEAASYTATYSGSPDADLRLEAFYLYDFTPYTPLAVDGPTNPSQPADEADTQVSQHHITGNDDTPCGPRHPVNPRLRSLYLPKELAIRQAAQSSSTREAYAPRPLILPQQVARRSADVETLLDDTNPIMLAESTAADGASVSSSFDSRPEATTNSFGPVIGRSSSASSRSDLIFWEAVEDSAVILPCYASSPALSDIVRDYQDLEADVR